MKNFTMETFQLPTPHNDLPALIVEGAVRDIDAERLRRAVDEAIPKLNACRRAVFDAFMGWCVMLKRMSSFWKLLGVPEQHPCLSLPSKEKYDCSCKICSCRSSFRRGAHSTFDVTYSDIHHCVEHAAFPRDSSWHRAFQIQISLFAMKL